MSADASTDPLSYAAALFHAVGTDREQVPAEIARNCLRASQLLKMAGARPSPTALIDGDPRASLRMAIRALVQLDEDEFTSQPVHDAVRLARQALRRLH